MKNSKLTEAYALLIIVLISQAFVVYLVLERQPNASDVSSQIVKNNQETQSKIQAIANSVASLSSTQNTLESQISQIKVNASDDFSGIAGQAMKGVVTIKTDIAQGSGIIITPDGYIVTNDHVIQGSSFMHIVTSDNKTYNGKLIGEDQNMDIALIKISGSFENLQLSDSNNVKVGDRIIAIGNPFGLSFTVTEGIISAINRTGTNNLPYYFQTDVSLNPGNSGGPLIGSTGKVIGINNFKMGGAENLGFALEINYARASINKIAQAQLGRNLV